MRIAIFIAVMTTALILESGGYTLWPFYFFTSLLLALLSIITKRYNDVVCVLLAAIGILVMLVPIEERFWNVFASTWWTLTAFFVWMLGNPGSSRVFLIMPIGYLIFILIPDNMIVWTLIESSYVAAILLSSRGARDAIMDLYYGATSTATNLLTNRVGPNHRGNGD